MAAPVLEACTAADSEIMEEINSTSIMQMCPEILTKIFSYLDTRSKGIVAQVCKSWKEIVYFTPQLWKDVRGNAYLDLVKRGRRGKKRSRSQAESQSHDQNSTDCTTSTTSFCDTSDRPVQKRRKVKPETSRSRSKLPPDLFKFMGERGVKKLSIWSVRRKYFEDDIEMLYAFLPDLEDLAFQSKTVIAKDFYHAFCKQRFEFLKFLDIGENPGVDHTTMKAIAQSMPNLKCLSLRSCNADDDSLREIPKMKKLEILIIGTNYRCTDAGIAYMCGMDANGNTLEEKSGASALHVLSIHHCPLLTGKSLEYIGQTMKLSFLNMSCNMQFQESDLHHVAQMKSLKHLIAHQCRFTKEAFKILATSGADLTTLAISHMRTVLDVGLEYLSLGLHSLVTLGVYSPNTCDESVTFICNHLPKLTCLDLSWSCITDQSLELIGKKLPNLKHLSVYSCPNLTQKGVESVRAHCEVEQDETLVRFFAINACLK